MYDPDRPVRLTILISRPMLKSAPECRYLPRPRGFFIKKAGLYTAGPRGEKACII